MKAIRVWYAVDRDGEGLEKEALIRCVEHLCDTLNEMGETFNIYKE